jgi:hypothetical protein
MIRALAGGTGVDHDPGRGGGMVYADGSNPSVRKDIGVRLPSPAQFLTAWWRRLRLGKTWWLSLPAEWTL